MLFSILIPVYNSEKYLNKCIQSVLNQTSKNFEIILCDDCSTDQSGRLCDEAAGLHPEIIKAVHNEKNCGQLITRRKLFGLAKGEWILCVDSDDLLADNALERLKEIIETHSPDMIVYDSKCIHVNKSVELFLPALKSGEIYAGDDKKQVYKAIYENRCLNSLCSKTFRRCCIDLEENYESYAGVRIGEDLFQSYPLFDRAEKIYYLNEQLYLYRKNEGSMTVSLKYDLYEMRKPLWKRENQYRVKWGLTREELHKANERRVKEIIGYLRSGTVEFGNDWLHEKATMIQRDGILEAACRSCNFNGRYRFYCWMEIHGYTSLLYRILRGEQAILKMLGKG